ncbi:1956_t:CDS:2 [Paraglomus brasilianum]|uniref:ATP-binding cassette sub-family B member 6 n=1 Tax=Paraglomus brasilianum TaxID=144538 RepID=A0A9N8WSH4_9GLOM|nr:1956_t:CDS:2 [Paraglomus brasilianum]
MEASPLSWEEEFFCHGGVDYHAFINCSFFSVYPIATFLLVFVLGAYRYGTVLRQRAVYQPLFESTNVTRLSTLSKAIYVLSALIVATYLIDSIILTCRALIEKYWTSTNYALYDVFFTVAWVINLSLMSFESKVNRTWSWIQYAFYWVVLAGNSVLLYSWLLNVTHDKTDQDMTIYDLLLFFTFIARYFLLLVATIAVSFHAFQDTVYDDVESGFTTNGSAYESLPNAAGDAQHAEGVSTWSDFFEKMRKLLPFLWPDKNRALQIMVFVCFLLMITGRIVNVLVPRQLKIITDELTSDDGHRPQFIWGSIALFVFFRFLQGGVGLIQSTQNYLWIRVGQYTTREISTSMFAHLHSLSLSFHINRKTGEVLRVMDRGTSSIVSLLNQILFQILPVIVDIVVAVIYFVIAFGWSFGSIVFVTMVSYIYVTISITEWRTKFRRRMIELDNDARAKAVDSLLNFETVKYYNAERFEIQRYDEAVAKYQEADYEVQLSLNVLNLSQNLIITLGLLVGTLLCAYRTAQGEFTVGHLVLFLTYISQLYTPLNFFGTYYRLIQSNFIDMEQMFDLFKQELNVKDAPDATELKVTEGTVTFENVCFSYDPRQQALNNVSFTIPQGKTVALVGPSGGGKSTILRLLFRFYDVESGRILIDGQDIRQVKQESLRRNVGVVPQDTVLFNDTIFYNIHYGNVNASENEVYKAAKAAQIHDRILTFPDGYETRVGERGLRLSGGEKQRVAIARTMLKDPQIILLDEATSALDTTTERQIQHALTYITKDRMTLVIAHRLSTIVNADLILAIKDGRIVESGTHRELIENVDGVYYEMWQKQLSEDQKIDASNN